MALSGCYSALKYIVVLLSFIFWLVGLAILGVAIWMLTDNGVFLSVAHHEMDYYTGVAILLVAGILMFLVGFLGCCGAFKESPCLLVVFFCVLLIVLVAEIAAGVWFFTTGPDFKTLLSNNIRETIKNDPENSNRALAFNTIQHHLQCCGAEGPGDWHNRLLADSKAVDLKNRATQSNFSLPLTCCKEKVPEGQCREAVKTSVAGPISNLINKEGCSNKLYDWITQRKDYVYAIVALVGLVQVLGLLLSLLLCCAVRSVNRYKS